MSVGKVMATIIDVNDLPVGEAFWSEVTGLDVIASGWNGRYSYLGGNEPGQPELTLQLVDTIKGTEPNRAHLDLAPAGGIDAAVQRIMELGGSVKKEPSIYPRPGSSVDVPPVADWAVMCDPFGNEFCLIDQLSKSQRRQVLEAAESGVTDDQELRVAAGVTR
jgi:predicted enzyme related to lactoylglutathione lyase